MVGPGRGAGAAEPGGGLPCPPTPFPLLLLAPCRLGGVSAPPLSPVPRGHRQGSPQTHGSPGVAGQEEWGQVWRGKAGWCWGCGLLEARGVKGGRPQGASGSKAGTGSGARCATESGCIGWGSLGPCLAWLGAATGPSTGSKEGQAAPRGQAGLVQGKEDPIHPHRGAGGSSRTGQAACGGESCAPLSAGPGHHSPTSPAGEEQLPPVKTPPHPPSVGHGPHGEQGGAPHQNQPWSCQGAQAIHSSEARRWGVLGTWGPLGHSRCQPTWLCGKHIRKVEKPSSSPANGTGGGVGTEWLS